jgi:arsenate reductase
MSADTALSVLSLCTPNSVRSQMAEAFLRRLGGDRYRPHSAGLAHTQIHPMTKTVTQEIGYDLTGHRSKSATGYLGKVSFTSVISVCEPTQADGPRMFPGALRYLNWPIPDPVAAANSPLQRLEWFRSSRDALLKRITLWLAAPESASAVGLPPSFH